MSYKERDIISENNGFAVVQFGTEFHTLANGPTHAIDFEAYGDKSLAVARMNYLAGRRTGGDMFRTLEAKSA